MSCGRNRGSGFCFLAGVAWLSSLEDDETLLLPLRPPVGCGSPSESDDILLPPAAGGLGSLTGGPCGRVGTLGSGVGVLSGGKGGGVGTLGSGVGVLIGGRGGGVGALGSGVGVLIGGRGGGVGTLGSGVGVLILGSGGGVGTLGPFGVPGLTDVEPVDGGWF